MRIAVVQPRAFRFAEEMKNLDRAIKYAERAARKEANIISFPECYPGPYSGPLNFSPVKQMLMLARNLGAYVLFGSATPVGTKIFNKAFLASPEGEIIGEHSKTIIFSVDKYLAGGRTFARGDRLNVFETKFGKIGLLICGEVLFPELSRILALKGADIILYPSGNVRPNFRETWQTLVWARAIENTVYVGLSQNLFADEEGFSCVASPEEILGENLSEGTLFADLNLERLEAIRRESLPCPSQETPVKVWLSKKPPYRAVPGLLRLMRSLKVYEKYVK